MTHKAALGRLYKWIRRNPLIGATRQRWVARFVDGTLIADVELERRIARLGRIKFVAARRRYRRERRGHR